MRAVFTTGIFAFKGMVSQGEAGGQRTLCPLLSHCIHVGSFRSMSAHFFFLLFCFVLRCSLSRLTHFSLLNVPLCFPPPRFFRQQTSLLTVLPVVIQSSLAVIGFLNAMLTVSTTAAAAAVSVAFVCVADVSVQSRSCHVFTVFTAFSLPFFLPDESSCCSHHATADMVCILPRILHQHRPLDSLLCFDLSSILSSSVRKMSVVRVSV